MVSKGSNQDLFWQGLQSMGETRTLQLSSTGFVKRKHACVEQQLSIAQPRLLKERAGASALVRFERALMLAKFLGDKCQERRATRGLAAAARLQVLPSAHAPSMAPWEEQQLVACIIAWQACEAPSTTARGPVKSVRFICG